MGEKINYYTEGNSFSISKGFCLKRKIVNYILFWLVFGFLVRNHLTVATVPCNSTTECGPTSQPSAQPTRQPSSQPSRRPSRQPSVQPSWQPFSKPSVQPSSQPSSKPSIPTSQPSSRPSIPTSQPSNQPSSRPTINTRIYFQYTGGVQNFTVPAGMNAAYVSIFGARGGNFTIGGYCLGGAGGGIQTTISVTANTMYYVFIGGKGADNTNTGGFNGGGTGFNLYGTIAAGGGGASDIRTSASPTAYSTRLVTAGGGGGCAYGCCRSDGGYGGRIGGSSGTCSCCGTKVNGATNSSGGSGNGDGSFGVGGTGNYFCGGGGGGYYGGGAGCWNGGGGGSSFSSGSGTTYVGSSSGHGYASILFESVPTMQPTSQPSSQPTRQPTKQPTKQPISLPSAQPSKHPSSQPSRQPSTQPSSRPSSPTSQPSAEPSEQPSSQPTVQPSWRPTTQPSVQPFSKPSSQPSAQPRSRPSRQPTRKPTGQPTSSPSCQPVAQPSEQPTCIPSVQPNTGPSSCPSGHPSIQPSVQPSEKPTICPTYTPSSLPSEQPFDQPSAQPTSQPTIQPSSHPSVHPSLQPSCQPIKSPSSNPTSQPSNQPTERPSRQPFQRPTRQPTRQPIERPSGQPSSDPSTQPTVHPSNQPSDFPSREPTIEPTSKPSSQPSSQPNSSPSCQPTLQPTHQATNEPSSIPTSMPSSQPSVSPSDQPSELPTSQPVLFPSGQPSIHPTSSPTNMPSNIPSDVPTSSPSIAIWQAPSSMLVFNKSMSVVGLSASKFKIVLPLSVSRASTESAFSNIVLRPDRDVMSYVLFGSSVLSSSVSVPSTHVKPFLNSVGFDDNKRSVAIIGDVNGDGHDDLLIGEPFVAKCYVFFGTHLGFANCTRGFAIIGESEGNLTGWSVSGAGDVNNDTFSDIIIGAPNAKGVGAFYVIYGNRNLTVDLYLDDITELQGFAVYGTNKADYLGISVSHAGDVNGDYCDDIIVGALETSRYYAGCAFVLYGKSYISSGYSINQFVATEVFAVRGFSFSFVGISVSSAGDFNNDGFDDIVIGRSSSKFGKTVYLIFGATSLNEILLSSMTSNQGMVISSAGSVVSALGDVNNDGFDDVLISSVGNGNNGMIQIMDFSVLVAVTELPTVTPTMISNLPTIKSTHFPTYLPSLKPTRLPSSFCPSVIPTVLVSSIDAPGADTSESPSISFNVSPTEYPIAPTEYPSFEPSIEPTEYPTLNPSFEPSESPTIEPSMNPSCCPSLMPTFGDTFAPSTSRPSNEILFRSPYSVPTLLPSAKASLPEVVDMVIDGQASFYNDSLSELSMRYVVNGTGLIEIDPSNGKCVYAIVPTSDLTLTILRFNVTSDRIDLTLYSDIHYYSDLTITAGSVIITLPSKEVIHIMNQEPSSMSEKNFILAPIKNNRNRLADGILEVLAITLPLTLVVAIAAFLYWLYGTVKSKINVVLTQRRYIGSFDLDEKGEYIEPSEVKSIDLSDHTIDSSGEWQDKAVQSHFQNFQNEWHKGKNMTVNNFDYYYNDVDGLNQSYEYNHSESFFYGTFVDGQDNVNYECDEQVWFSNYYIYSDQRSGDGYQEYYGDKWAYDVESNYNQDFQEPFEGYSDTECFGQSGEFFHDEDNLEEGFLSMENGDN